MRTSTCVGTVQGCFFARVKTKQDVKSKPVKTNTVDDEGEEAIPSPAPPAGINPATVPAGPSSRELQEVVGHLSPEVLQKWV